MAMRMLALTIAVSLLAAAQPFDSRLILTARMAAERSLSSLDLARDDPERAEGSKAERFAQDRPHGQSRSQVVMTPDRTIVISGDTGPDSRIEDQGRRCDVLVHEVYSEAGFARRPKEWQADHSRYHTSTRKLGAIASRARPGLLVLYHQLIWSSTEAELLAEVRSAYDGEVVSAHDLDVY